MRSLLGVGAWSSFFALGCAHAPLLVSKSPTWLARSPEFTAASPSPSPNARPAPATPSGALDTKAIALPQFGNAPIAEGGPLLVERSSPDGRWLAVCQARRDSTGDGKLGASVAARGELHGDDFERYLIAPGEELAVDEVLGADPTGRFVLIEQRGVLGLWDSETRETLNLSALDADMRLSAQSLAALRTLDFDASGEHLLYVRYGDRGPRVVVRSLREGTERALDPGPGAIWRARFDPGGAYLIVELMREDSNKNGRIDFPAPLLAAPRPCSAGPGRFHVWSGYGDRAHTVLVPLSGAPAIDEPSLLMAVGDALLLRAATGALILERGGKRSEVEPAACRGRVVHADAVRELFIIGCGQKKGAGRVSLELSTPTGRKPLDIELASFDLDRELSDAPRLLALYPGANSALFDADKRELLSLSPGDSVLTTRGARALIRRGNALLLYDADSRSAQVLPGTVDKFPQILLNAEFALVYPLLVNLDTAAVLPVGAVRPLALSRTGQLLVSEAAPDASGLVTGPLHWSSPGS